MNTFELSGGEMIWEYILGLLFDTFELPPQQGIKVTSVCFLAKLIHYTTTTCHVCCSNYGVSNPEILRSTSSGQDIGDPCVGED